MQRKSVIYKPKGMMKDYSASSYPQEYALDIRNMRLLPDTEGTGFSWSREKSSRLVATIGRNTKEKVIGQAYVPSSEDETLVLFTTDGTTNRIRRYSIRHLDTGIRISETSYNGKPFFEGDLGMDIEHPVDTLVNVENEALKKVYWVDGKNLLRYANFSASNTKPVVYTIPMDIDDSSSVSVTVNKSGGSFPAGVIQFVCTYSVLYGYESAPFYTSGMYYLGGVSMGLDTDEVSSFSFRFDFRNVNTDFDVIYLYSILRTSYNGTPQVRRQTLYIKQGTMDFVERGSGGEQVDPTEVLFLGSTAVIANTLCQKDNTLFLGNYKTESVSLSNLMVNGADEDILLPEYVRKYCNGRFILGSVEGKRQKKVWVPDTGVFYPNGNNLAESSRQKVFRYMNTYVFGMQFMDKYGKWSEVVPFSVQKETLIPQTTYMRALSAEFPYFHTMLDGNLQQALVSNGFTKARMVRMEEDRMSQGVLCSGMICPTVFNAGFRRNNTIAAQSSWFARPNAPYDLEQTIRPYRPFSQKQGDLSSATKDTAQRNAPTTSYSSYSRYFLSMTDIKPNLFGSSRMDFRERVVNYGALIEFRHHCPLFPQQSRACEIQGTDYTFLNYNDSSTSSDGGAAYPGIWARYENILDKYFYVDQNICTFHSPDIELSEDLWNVNFNDYNIIIHGIIPLSENATNLSIATSSIAKRIDDWPEHGEGQPMDMEVGFNGLDKFPVRQLSRSYQGFRTLCAGGWWYDQSASNKDVSASYLVYPFHRSGSLNNQNAIADDGSRSAMLETKTILNYRVSENSFFFGQKWRSDTDGNGLSDIKLFKETETIPISLKVPSHLEWKTANIFYYGNMDTSLNMGEYDVMATDKGNFENSVVQWSSFYNYSATSGAVEFKQGDEVVKSTDFVRMKYKSSPHLVFALESKQDTEPWNRTLSGVSKEWHEVILPVLMDGQEGYYISQQLPIEASGWNYVSKTKWPINWISNYLVDYRQGGGVGADGNAWPINLELYGPLGNFHWYSQKVIDYDFSGMNLSPEGYASRGPERGWFWYASLIKNVDYDLNSSYVLNSTWIPCGDAVDLDPGKDIELTGTEGDAWYQRYDCLKTYPASIEDENGIVDIVSFMCESGINLEGRHDANQGNYLNMALSPQNFNLVNTIYSQPNNFFTYRAVNDNLITLDEFPNGITWTLTKTQGEQVDSWTHVTLSSVMDLDGDKGSLTALKRFNNQLIAFQENGFSQVLYNESVQMASTSGVPIEIANSGKVQGKRYVSNIIGCQNKWAIEETSSGIYFVDSNTRAIYLFNGQVNNLTDSMGMHSWMNALYIDKSPWNPSAITDKFRLFYDKTDSMVYFSNGRECLCFSEQSKGFLSFISYQNALFAFNTKDCCIVTATLEDTDNLYELRGGSSYGGYLGKSVGYSMELLVNPDMQNDKIFTNLFILGDTWPSSLAVEDTYVKPDQGFPFDFPCDIPPFSVMKAWNEYQDTGNIQLSWDKNGISDIKKKFRMWRVNSLRDSRNILDRIRNNWMRVRLEGGEKQQSYKVLIHDIQVDYFV